jgi:hypothetical protein
VCPRDERKKTLRRRVVKYPDVVKTRVYGPSGMSLNVVVSPVLTTATVAAGTFNVLVVG